MKRQPYIPQVTIVMHSGQSCSLEEFLVKPLPVDPERFAQVAELYALEVDPAYRAKKAAEQRWARVEQRQRELAKRQAEITAEQARI